MRSDIGQSRNGNEENFEVIFENLRTNLQELKGRLKWRVRSAEGAFDIENGLVGMD